jgi:ribose 5-phosphate isomerase A
MAGRRSGCVPIVRKVQLVSMDDQQRLSRLAHYVASTIPTRATLGLGSGSTAEAVVHALSERVRAGLDISGVATSKRTAELARSVGVRLIDFDEIDTLDLGIDGSDEISPQLDLVKGRGGALLFEKLVALACRRFVIVASSEKLVEELGTRLPLPVEVIPFGWQKTAERLRKLGLAPSLRINGDSKAFVSDGGHYILDCAKAPISNPKDLDGALKATAGVVDHGLFIGLADQAIIIDGEGQLISVTRHGRRPISLD